MDPGIGALGNSIAFKMDCKFNPKMGLRIGALGNLIASKVDYKFNSEMGPRMGAIGPKL
jgi:hypothetical protein